MTIDAFFAILGPARVQRWMSASKEAYERACKEEEHFVEALEQQLGLQLRQKVVLTAPLVPVRIADKQSEGRSLAEENIAEPRPSLQIGHADGLAPLQASILAALLDQPFDVDASLNYPVAPRRQAQAVGFDGALASYRHLLDHHPQSGLYVPLAFPRPLELLHRGDLVSIGSLMHLQTELSSWNKQVLPNLETMHVSAPEWLLANADNLSKMINSALEQGVALELF